MGLRAVTNVRLTTHWSANYWVSTLFTHLQSVSDRNGFLRGLCCRLTNCILTRLFVVYCLVIVAWVYKYAILTCFNLYNRLNLFFYRRNFLFFQLRYVVWSNKESVFKSWKYISCSIEPLFSLSIHSSNHWLLKKVVTTVVSREKSFIVVFDLIHCKFFKLFLRPIVCNRVILLSVIRNLFCTIQDLIIFVI